MDNHTSPGRIGQTAQDLKEYASLRVDSFRLSLIDNLSTFFNSLFGVFILIVLKKLRKHPAAEFVAAVALCGTLEYISSWHLEMTKGQRWWDYTGYFLNVNGRICAEGLLVFGLGGLAIVYLVAPTLNQLLDRINRKALLCVALVLLVSYIGDQIYSAQHPNSGHGITDTGSSSVEVRQ